MLFRSCTVSSDPGFKERKNAYKMNESFYESSLPFLYTFQSTTCSLLIQPLGIFGTDSFPIQLGFPINSGAASSALGSCIFITGGNSTEIKNENIEVRIDFEKRIGTFKYHKNMILPRFSHGLIALNNKSLLTIGGISLNNELTASCEIYNLKDDEWKNTPPIPHKRKNFGLCKFMDNCIYVFGGLYSETEKIDEFNIDKKSWSTISITEMQNWMGNENIGAIQLHDKILVFGGTNSDGSDTFYFYNKEMTMRKIDSIKTEVKSEALCLTGMSTIVQYQGRIYCTGEKGKVFIYTSESQKWNETFIQNS